MSQFRVADIIKRMGIQHAVQVQHKICPQWIKDYAATVKGYCYAVSLVHNHQSLVSGDMVLMEEPTMVDIGFKGAMNAIVNRQSLKRAIFNHDGRVETTKTYDVSVELYPYMIVDGKTVPVESYVLLHDGEDSILFYPYSTGLPKREHASKDDNIFTTKTNKE